MPLTEDMFTFINNMLFTAHVASQNKVNNNRNPVVPYLATFPKQSKKNLWHQLGQITFHLSV